MADSAVLREFLVALGFRVDESGQRKFIDGVAAATLQVLKLGTAIEAAAVAMVTGVAVMADQAEKLYFMSQRTRASVENIQAFGFAMSQMGSSVGQARAAIEGMASFLRSSPGAGNLLQSIGIDPNQDPAQITQRFFEYARQIPIWRARLYASMFGIDETTLLAGIRGVEGFGDTYRQMLQRSGLNVQQAATDAHGFMVELRTLFAALDILGQKINASLYRPLGQDLAQLRLLIVNNFDVITRTITGIVRGVVLVAEVFTRMLIRGGEAIAGLIDWFYRLDPRLKAALETFAALYGAWRLLNAGFLATPLGIIATLIAGLVLLYDDYRTWKEGGKSLIDWAAWEPGITKALAGIKWITDHLTTLAAMMGPTGVEAAAAAMLIYMAGPWAVGMIAAFGSVMAALAPILAGIAAVAGLADIIMHPFGNIAGPDQEQKLLQQGDVEHGQPPRTGPQGANPAQDAINFFMSPAGGGYDLAHAAAIAASAQRESQYGTDPATNTGSHKGIFQWDAARQAAIEAHFGKRIDQMTRQEQYAALAWEISEGGPEHDAGRRFRAASGAHEAGREFAHSVERPGSYPEEEERGNLTERIARQNIIPVPDAAHVIHIEQNNPITITGVSDPTRAANLAGAAADRSNADLLRNLTGSAR